MTLRPIPGAPIDAPIPDFPTSEPGPLVVPDSRFMCRSVDAPPPSIPSPAPARRPGPVEIRGDGGSILTFRAIPEVPAINRSSLSISVTGEPAKVDPPPMKFNLATDEAKAFLVALRDGGLPVVVTDGRSGFQVEFAMTDDGSAFIVSKPGQAHAARRFNVAESDDVKTMAANLLADLGP